MADQPLLFIARAEAEASGGGTALGDAGGVTPAGRSLTTGSTVVVKISTGVPCN
jgi:hypothetical protein